ncbi:uncharacterized protein SCHCODRAFT_02062768 [Schizophyllum commune H4-8]|uniref:uncharacterized protein n=1 Tax=Schizophyllum commune (strain H4-8 / FGSC 9210) TaxID=578458 RepID=UPI00215EB74C|nr:uncharacterized protein SCHCODRAFT_02062768 [Schizophyllum commune H4-8]KAI5888796.1 hypothetical protein SCHCODRAFT_02062768 [Schizophyllum commune H4-8]
MKVATGLRQLAILLRPSPTLLRAVLAPEEVAKSRTAATPLTEVHSSIPVARGPSRTWAGPGDSAIHSIHSQGDCRSPSAVIVGREARALNCDPSKAPIQDRASMEVQMARWASCLPRTISRNR